MLGAVSLSRAAQLVLCLFQAKCAFYQLLRDPRTAHSLCVSNSALFLLLPATPARLWARASVFAFLSLFVDAAGALSGLQPAPDGPCLLLNLLCLAVLFWRLVAARAPLNRATLAFCGWASAAVYLLRLALFCALSGARSARMMALPAATNALLMLNAAALALFALDVAGKARRFAEALSEGR